MMNLKTKTGDEVPFEMVIYESEVMGQSGRVWPVIWPKTVAKLVLQKLLHHRNRDHQHQTKVEVQLEEVVLAKVQNAMHKELKEVVMDEHKIL